MGKYLKGSSRGLIKIIPEIYLKELKKTHECLRITGVPVDV
jgi:hypothetical protein